MRFDLNHYQLAADGLTENAYWSAVNIEQLSVEV